MQNKSDIVALDNIFVMTSLMSPKCTIRIVPYWQHHGEQVYGLYLSYTKCRVSIIHVCSKIICEIFMISIYFGVVITLMHKIEKSI